MAMSVRVVLNAGWYRRAQPTVVGPIPSQVVLGCVRKHERVS